MAHKALVGGTAYDTKGGRCRVSGTNYSIKKGRTLVGGTGYDVNFAKMLTVTITGDYIYPSSNSSRHHYAIINGVEYSQAGSFQIPEGTTITIHIYASSTGVIKTVELNGTVVAGPASSQRELNYDFVLTADAKIEFGLHAGLTGRLRTYITM